MRRRYALKALAILLYAIFACFIIFGKRSSGGSSDSRSTYGARQALALGSSSEEEHLQIPDKPPVVPELVKNVQNGGHMTDILNAQSVDRVKIETIRPLIYRILDELFGEDKISAKEKLKARRRIQDTGGVFYVPPPADERKRFIKYFVYLASSTILVLSEMIKELLLPWKEILYSSFRALKMLWNLYYDGMVIMGIFDTNISLITTLISYLANPHLLFYDFCTFMYEITVFPLRMFLPGIFDISEMYILLFFGRPLQTTVAISALLAMVIS